jgi:hypothetical protein
MATNEERLKILSMLQDGVINAEDAARLLESLAGENSENKSPAETNFVSSNLSRSAKYFRVRVTDTDSGKTRVNIRLPIGLVGAGLKMGMKFSPEIEGIDADILQEFLTNGAIGQIVDVFDDEDGEHVEVFIE